MKTKENREKFKEYAKDGKFKLLNEITPIICLTTKRLFTTMGEASRYYNIDKGAICRACQGQRKSAGTYKGERLKWKYLNYKHGRKYKGSWPKEVKNG